MKSLLKLTAVLAIGVWLVAGNTYPAAASAEEADNQSSQPESVLQVAETVYGSMMLGIPSAQFDKAVAFIHNVANVQVEEVDSHVQ